MTIQRRGLLLVSIPLLAQAIFVGILLEARAEDASAQFWAVHTKQVIATVEETYRRLLESYAAMRNRIVIGEPGAGELSVHAADAVNRKIAELKALVSDNADQGRRVDELAQHSDAIQNVLSRQEQLMREGKQVDAYKLLDDGGQILGQTRVAIDQILTSEGVLDQSRTEKLARTGRWQFWVLLVGGLAILAGTLLLALNFFHSVIKRLAVLSDNARRFAAGQGLQPRLAGSDEVAAVDRAFHEMAESLDEKKQENEMFVYSVSHDLRSPLINLQGFSEELNLSYRDLRALFEEGGVPEAVRVRGLALLTENIKESIHYIHAAVGRLSRIIDSLLRLSRAGRVEYQWQKVDVGEVVGKIVDALHDAVSDKRATINVGELPPAWGDPTAVEQIFANLIGNAVQYLDPARPGRIEVEEAAASSNGNLQGFQVYSVKDNGLGVPAAYQHRLFTAFNRLHTDVPQGEGIGLALVRRIVERHGGTVWMESAHGAGSTFFVAIPAEAPPGTPAKTGGRALSYQNPAGAQSSWQQNRS
jgi:signal transduction histidine kinase